MYALSLGCRERTALQRRYTKTCPNTLCKGMEEDFNIDGPFLSQLREHLKKSPPGRLI